MASTCTYARPIMRVDVYGRQPRVVPATRVGTAMGCTCSKASQPSRPTLIERRLASPHAKPTQDQCSQGDAGVGDAVNVVESSKCAELEGCRGCPSA